MTGQTPQQDGHGRPRDDAGEATRDDSGQTGRSSGDDAWDGLVLDEEFVREANTTEPSARARMLAARWRRDKPDPQPWRSDEPPAGWFFSKGRRRRWRRG
ncbi:SGM_3592 family protein [Streptomyces parvulus]|uniref:SGM_3592 family protein n=1 Tax=Streptomyces parvulus TaxID=146923 RepID=UPI0037D271DC